MTRSMSVAAEAREVLDLERLKPLLPSSIPVRELDVEDYIDSTGDPALMIRLVIGEETDIEHISGKDVGDLKRAFRDTLRDHDIPLFAYFALGKPSEWEETDEESQ